MGNNFDDNFCGRCSIILVRYPAVIIWETMTARRQLCQELQDLFHSVHAFFKAVVFWPWKARVLGCFAQQARSGRHDVQPVKISQF